MYGGDHSFSGNEGIDLPGYTYLSMNKPRAFAVVNNSANASNLAFFRNYGLEMSLPGFNHTGGLSSSWGARAHVRGRHARQLQGGGGEGCGGMGVDACFGCMLWVHVLGACFGCMLFMVRVVGW